LQPFPLTNQLIYDRRVKGWGVALDERLVSVEEAQAAHVASDGAPLSARHKERSNASQSRDGHPPLEHPIGGEKLYEPIPELRVDRLREDRSSS
jgi:hypothetical protein